MWVLPSFCMRTQRDTQVVRVPARGDCSSVLSVSFLAGSEAPNDPHGRQTTGCSLDSDGGSTTSLGLPSTAPSTAAQPQGTTYKAISPSSPAAQPHTQRSLELNEIFYDPTLRYVLLKAPVLASAGTAAMPCPEA